MNLGDRNLDAAVVSLAQLAKGKGYSDHDLPFSLCLARGIDLSDPSPAPMFSPTSATKLTLGQVFGTVKRLSEKVSALELDLKVSQATVDVIVAHHKFLTASRTGTEEEIVFSREEWNDKAAYLRSLEKSQEILRKEREG